MRKIVIDADPGHDDVIAILCAYYSKQLDILGISTVGGNQTLDKVTNNILKVFDYLDINIPVYRGYSSPIIKELEVQPVAHGESGMDGPILDEPKSKAEDIHAIEFYKNVFSKENASLVCMAPLTNVALFIKTYPELCKNIEEIVLMGGSINGGNIQLRSEFNLYQDPEASRIVFESGIKIVMCPMEVCYSASILLKEIEEINRNNKVSLLVYDLLKFYSKYALIRNWDRTAIFDLVTIMYLLKEDLFEYVMGDISIELDGEYCRGMSILSPGDSVKVLMSCKDRKEFIDYLYNILDLR